MTDEAKVSTDAAEAAARARIESARKAMAESLAGNVPAPTSEDGDDSGTDFQMVGTGDPPAEPCDPDQIEPLVRGVWLLFWKGMAKLYKVELPDGILPEESTRAIAEAAAPVIDKHAPGLNRYIGPESTLAKEVAQHGAMPAMAIRAAVQEREEQELDPSERNMWEDPEEGEE